MLSYIHKTWHVFVLTNIRQQTPDKLEWDDLPMFLVLKGSKQNDLNEGQALRQHIGVPEIIKWKTLKSQKLISVNEFLSRAC